jgi:hypothetical protein
MCDIATAGLALSLASTAIQAQSRLREGQAAQSAANYKAQVGEGEAGAQRRLAQMEMEKGAEERGRLIRAGLARQGEMAAGLGASGFTLDQGSGPGLLARSAEEIQQGISRAALNSNMKAWNHWAGAGRAASEAALARFQGQAAAGQGKMAAAGTLLGGIGRGLAGYYK